MAVYRANILKIEPTADKSLHADAVLELRTATNPVNVWKPIVNGHFTIVLGAEAVLAVTENTALTNVQKKKALLDLIKAEALKRGLDRADMAYADWEKLFPIDQASSTYPIEVIIRQ